VNATRTAYGDEALRKEESKEVIVKREKDG
jgi:hypothetical protein